MLGGVAGQHRSLNRGTVRHRLVRVYRLVQGFPVEVVGEELLNFGDARGTSDEHDLFYLFCEFFCEVAFEAILKT